MKNKQNIGVILLAGGQGLRFGSQTPKQFVPIHNKPIALYSYEIFSQRKDILEIVIVCDEPYRHYFDSEATDVPIKFALPGERRQDSVYNGLQMINPKCDFICIHDSARPLISQSIINRLVEGVEEYGAATSAVPIKFTVKECNDDLFVNKTPDRSKIWEIQTPQMVRTDLLHNGFDYAREKNITVTDDVSLIELLNLPVKLVNGDYSNLKITTKDDLYLAERLLQETRNE